MIALQAKRVTEKITYEEFLAKYYYPKDKITRWNIEKIGEKLSREDLPKKDAARFMKKIEKITKKKPEELNQNFEFTRQILKQKSEAVYFIRTDKEDEFIKKIESQIKKDGK